MPISAANHIQALRPGTEVSEQESLKLTRNLLQIAMFNISYIRGLFPDSYFVDKYVPALEMKVKILQPVDMESKRFIDWMEKGAFDALQKKYLRTLFLTICGRHDGPLEEEYIFSFKYASNEASGNITSMTIETITSSDQHSLANTYSKPTPLHMRKSACKMVRTLVQLMHTLDNIPEERTIVMKLHYYDDITLLVQPADYEPPFFTSNTNEDPTVWSREPLQMKVGHVDSKHYKLGIKIKTVFDPCQDEINLVQNQSCSALLVKSEFNSSSDSESLERDTQPSQLDVLAPASSDLMKVQAEGACQAGANSTHEDAAAALVEKLKNMTATEDAPDVDSDKTEDAQYEAESLRAIRHYLLHRENPKVKMIDILEEFPQLSMALIKELVERLVKDDLLTKHSKSLYHIKRTESGWKQTSKHVELNAAGDKAHGVTTRSHKKEHRYKTVQFHTLLKDHISAALLRDVLPGVSDYILRQDMLRMLREGFIENKLNNGKIHIHTDCKVLHSPEADKKLQELSAYFGADVQTVVKNIEQSNKVDMSQPPSIPVQEVPHTELPKTCAESTHGMVKDFGSEVTRQEVVGPENSTGNLCKHIDSDVNLKEMSLAFPTKDLSKVQHQPQTSSALVPTPVQGKATDKLPRAIDNSQSPTIVNIVDNHNTMDTFGQHHGLPRRLKASKVDHPIYHDLPPLKRLRPE